MDDARLLFVVLAVASPSLHWVEQALEGLEYGTINALEGRLVVRGIGLAEAFAAQGIPHSFDEFMARNFDKSAWSAPSALVPTIASNEQVAAVGANTSWRGGQY